MDGRAGGNSKSGPRMFTCPLCQEPVSSQAVVEATEEIGTAKEFPCPHCNGLVSKAPSKGSNASKLERRLRNGIEYQLPSRWAFFCRAPLFAQVRRRSERVRVPISDQDRTRLDGLALASPFWFPVNDVIEGERFVKDCCYAYGISRIHHFYLPRQLVTYSCLWEFCEPESRSCAPERAEVLRAVERARNDRPQQVRANALLSAGISLGLCKFHRWCRRPPTAIRTRQSGSGRSRSSRSCDALDDGRMPSQRKAARSSRRCQITAWTTSLSIRRSVEISSP